MGLVTPYTPEEREMIYDMALGGECASVISSACRARFGTSRTRDTIRASKIWRRARDKREAMLEEGIIPPAAPRAPVAAPSDPRPAYVPLAPSLGIMPVARIKGPRGERLDRPVTLAFVSILAVPA